MQRKKTREVFKRARCITNGKAPRVHVPVIRDKQDKFLLALNCQKQVSIALLGTVQPAHNCWWNCAYNSFIHNTTFLCCSADEDLTFQWLYAVLHTLCCMTAASSRCINAFDQWCLCCYAVFHITVHPMLLIYKQVRPVILQSLLLVWFGRMAWVDSL